MAKKLLSFENPLVARSGSVISPQMWIGSILWVVMIGIILSLGVRVFSAFSRRTGVATPNMGLFQGNASRGITIL